MIYVTGDTHTEWMKRLNMESFPEQRQLTKEDVVIICGDFGIWDRSKREDYGLDWLEKRSFTTLFVAGNHDNYDILDELPRKEWRGGIVNEIRPSVLHLNRGEVFEIEGKHLFTFGGGSSHDIEDGILDRSDPGFRQKKKQLDRNGGRYRINHVSWWERELPSEEEMERGIYNLKRWRNTVDYIITHSPCTSMMHLLEAADRPYKEDRLTEYLQELKETVTYRHWYCGHMHVNFSDEAERMTCVYEQILRVG